LLHHLKSAIGGGFCCIEENPPLEADFLSHGKVVLQRREVMNVHCVSKGEWLYNYINQLLGSGQISQKVVDQLESEGYQIVRGGIYPIGIKVGQTIYYHPKL
jgi:hypothetical protein